MPFMKGAAMRRNAIVRLLVLLAMLCAGAVTRAQDVQYHYDRDTDFTAYKTYQWVEHEARIGDQLLDKDIRRAIDDQMSQKGLRKV